MFEKEYYDLFVKFFNDLTELTKKRKDAKAELPFEYIFYVRNKNKTPVFWKTDIQNYDHRTEMVENVIHESICDDFDDPKYMLYDRDMYFDHQYDFISDVIKDSNKRLNNMSYSHIYLIERDHNGF